ncbi:MAG TPA: HAMP domain-containing sensor histidine kinase [Isosphaeraceae bacterium]|nr:HAMP domain-containing sensor histidine kinase [Isosphaeraceae bacterium]
MGIRLDSRFLSMVVHDLRTPLNVIGLTLRLIDQAVPKGSSDLDEDLRVVQENVAQIERMLSHLTDYCRLVDDPVTPKGSPFDPRRMASDLVAERMSRSTKGGPAVSLEVAERCPSEVVLDPNWARLAVHHALANASASAEGAPVRVRLDGSPGHLVVEVTVDRAPPTSVQATPLEPDLYERLFGNAHERRGLDLAIAARVTELFGGTAKLEVTDGKSTTILLDWPAPIASP